MNDQIVLETKFERLKLFKRGKVRDVYDLDDHLLIVATDRISAFDVVFPTGIPNKGVVLTGLSAFWFGLVDELKPSHLVTMDIDRIIQQHGHLKPHRDVLAGRTMLVKKTRAIPIECVVRGYLAGSGWKEYQETRSICGIPLPPGLRESEQLPNPIFTPSTKEETGHDINISHEEMARRVGEKLTQELKEASLAFYALASDYTKSRGIILVDTKFEFGLLEDRVTFIDELLTPDSSRFWPVQGYKPGQPQPSYDKQFVRDYLENIGWNKMPPAPELPENIVLKTSTKYIQALHQLTGKSPSDIVESSRFDKAQTGLGLRQHLNGWGKHLLSSKDQS